MHPADIKAALEKSRSSQAAVARSLIRRSGRALTRTAVFHVINGTSSSTRIARRISEVTGLPVATLWPGKYPLLEAEQARTARTATPATKHRKAA